MNYEARKISRAIVESLREQALGENTNRETNKPMITETENQAIARAQHYENMDEDLTVGFMNTPFQKQHAKMVQKRLDTLAAGRLAYALQCRHEFDREACLAQFNSECA